MAYMLAGLVRIIKFAWDVSDGQYHHVSSLGGMETAAGTTTGEDGWKMVTVWLEGLAALVGLVEIRQVSITREFSSVVIRC